MILIAAIKMIFCASVGLIFYAYAIYPILLLALSIAHGKRSGIIGHIPETLPSVSIVIAAYNEEDVIEKRLENLFLLDYPKENLEIVVVSDESTDNTDDIVRRYASSGVKLIRQNERSGKVNALNVATPKVAGEIVVYSDANTMFEKDAVKKLVRNFSDARIGCVCGELIFKDSEDSEGGKLEGVYWRYEQFLKGIEGARGSLLGANGGIYAIRKSLFDPVPSDTIVEDFVIPMRILEKGYKVIYEPEAIAYEEASKKIVQEMERRIRIGAGDFQALLLTWRILNPAHGFTAFTYFSHKVLRWFAPFLLIAAFVTNLMLMGNEYYSVLLLLQCMFYIAALAGRIFSQLGVRFKIFGLPYYFISMNIALFLGFIRFCTKSQSVAWKRTER